MPAGGHARTPRRVRLTLEFDGSDFAGWQTQPGGIRTVQGAVEHAFLQLPGDHGTVCGAGRTDAKVHALAMVAHADTTSEIPAERLRLALNAHLPRDVAVLDVHDVPPDFEAQFDCRYRRYVYRMRVVRGVPRGLALDRHRVLAVHVPLDVAAMEEAASAWVGRHDFSSVATQETRTKERTVLLCDLRDDGDEIRLHVAADGFLRGMVRAIVGTLLRVGRGTERPDAIAEILAARDRRRAGPAAPPHALYFVEAGYEPWDPVASDAHAARLLRGLR